MKQNIKHLNKVQMLTISALPTWTYLVCVNVQDKTKNTQSSCLGWSYYVL